jgi:hypothetical protein
MRPALTQHDGGNVKGIVRVSLAGDTKCKCGSGLAFKKCHGKPRPIPPDVIRKVRAKIQEKIERKAEYQKSLGHARTPVTAVAGDKRYIVIGSSIYIQTREGEYQFADVTHDCALDLFGVPFLEEQEKLPLDQRHPALQWLYQAHEYDQRQTQIAPDAPRKTVGVYAAWLRMGYDLFTIRDNAKLHGEMKRRLLAASDFQGARHELAVAAMCVAAGFEINFENEKDGSTTHPEFIGVDKLTGEKIAVEAKSRHRKGVKAFTGGKDVSPGHQVGIRGLVTDAFKKETEHPFYVFVDTNLPAPADVGEFERWQIEISQTMADLDAEGYTNPCAANAVFFTNDPSHYLGVDEIGQEKDKIWFRQFPQAVPRVAHPASDMPARFFEAYKLRIAPPAHFLDNN